MTRARSVPLPQLAHLDSVGATLTAEQSDLADGLAIRFADCRGWKDRAALVDEWLCGVAARENGAGLPPCIPVITTMLEARDDAVIVCADMAGLYMVSRYENWRHAARDFFVMGSLDELESWLQAHSGVALLMGVFVVAHGTGDGT